MSAIPNSYKLSMEKDGRQQHINDHSNKLMESNQDSQKEQRARLIRELGKFKPKDANPLQFYNCVREFCIMHNCSIDEGMDRAFEFWPTLSLRQRALYNSQRHAELPIPVPRHLIYRAFQMERNGRWSLGRAPVGDNGGTMYTVESYKPPQKVSKFRAYLNAKKPKYDNMIDPLTNDSKPKRKNTVASRAVGKTQSLPGTSGRWTYSPPQKISLTIGRPKGQTNSISSRLPVKSNVKLMKKNRSCPCTGGPGRDGANICDRKVKKKSGKSNNKPTKRNSTSKKKSIN